jgi:hypothetical protein
LGGKSIDKIIELEEPLYFLDTDLSEKKEKIESISYSDLNNFLEIEDSDFEFTELEIENESFNVIIK